MSSRADIRAAQGLLILLGLVALTAAYGPLAAARIRASARPGRPAPAQARRLVGCVPRGSSEVFRGGSTVRQIALTFDDGPSSRPPTMQFVNLLSRLHVPATFFEIGSQIATYDRSGRIERAMLSRGDMIGIHTWSHPQMPWLPTAAQTSQLQRTAQAIRQRTGFTPCLWRAPGGRVSARLIRTARSLGLLTIMWDVDPRDWALPGSATIASRVIRAAHNGAIVIQHYGGGPRYQTLAALSPEISALRRRRYRFVTVTQLLGLKLIYR